MKNKSITKIAGGILICLLTFIAMGSNFAEAEAGTPPDINVTVDLDKSQYIAGEPVTVTLTLQNAGVDKVTLEGFKATDFRLLLEFIDPDGMTVHADPQASGDPLSEPLAPDVVQIDGVPTNADVVEVVEAGWSQSFTFNAHDYYTLSKQGAYSVRAEIQMKTYPQVDTVLNGVNYSAMNSVDWSGILVSGTSEFTITGDLDADGYSYPVVDSRISPYFVPDCNDTDAGVNPGAAEIAGNGVDDDCDPLTMDGFANGSLMIQADIHTVGSGSRPGSTKGPLAGLPVRVYDKSDGSCAKRLGTSWQQYRAIWLSCNSVPYGFADTDASGAANMDVAPGNYLVVGKYTAQTGEYLYIGGSIGEIQPEESRKQYLQVIVKADGKIVPAKYTLRTGSQLLIIEPEYTEWNGTEEYYPFIFESIGDWSVTTSVSPPEGFVADHEYLTEDVNTELEAVQFTITDIGSKWVGTGVTHTLKHKGKTEKIKTKIGIKCSKKLAKEKNFDRFCREQGSN